MKGQKHKPLPIAAWSLMFQLLLFFLTRSSSIGKTILAPDATNIYVLAAPFFGEKVSEMWLDLAAIYPHHTPFSLLRVLLTPKNHAIAGQRNCLQSKSDSTGEANLKNGRVAIRVDFYC